MSYSVRNPTTHPLQRTNVSIIKAMSGCDKICRRCTSYSDRTEQKLPPEGHVGVKHE